MKKEYLKEEWEKFPELSPSVWYGPIDKQIKTSRVCSKFKGAAKNIRAKYFYDLYRHFSIPMKKQKQNPLTLVPTHCEIENMVLIKALVYLDLGRNMTVKGSDGVKIELVFDKLQAKNNWLDINTNEVKDNLIAAFRKEYMSAKLNIKKEKATKDKYLEEHLPEDTEFEQSTLNEVENAELSFETSKDSKTEGTMVEYLNANKRSGNFLGTVPFRTDDFLIRKPELDRLLTALSGNQKIVVLHGVPGIGKTSLIKYFVNEYRDHFDNVAWISIDRSKDEFSDKSDKESQSKFEEAFQPIYRLLNPNRQHNDGLSIRDRFTDVIVQLNNIEGNNLLVVDNCDDSIIQLMGLLRWKILATCRYKVIGTEDLPFTPFSETEAEKLFEMFYTRPVDKDLLKIFLKEIDYHTLMIEIAAKSLNESSWLTLKYLYQRLTNGQLDDPELDQEIVTEHGADGELIKHLLRLLDYKSLSQEEVTVLKTWYYIRPFSYTTEEISNFTGIPLQDRKLRSLLNKLSKKGWIEFDSMDRRYSVHRLIQKAILYGLSPKAPDIKSLIMFYESLFPKNRIETSEFENFENLDYLFKQLQNDKTLHPSMTYLVFCQSYTYIAKDLLEEGEVFLEEIIHICDELIMQNNLVEFVPLKKIAMIQIGHFYNIVGEYETAEKKLLEVLPIALDPSPFESEDNWRESLSKIYKKLIEVYTGVSKKEATESYLEKLVNLMRGQLDSEIHDIVLDTQLNNFINAKDYINAWSIEEQLFEEYTKRYENGQMELYAYSKKKIERGNLLEKLDKTDEALENYYDASNLIKELAFSVHSPLYDDILFASQMRICELLLEKNEMGDWIENMKLSWRVCFNILRHRPNFWSVPMVLCLSLIETCSRPLPNYLVNMLRLSLRAVFSFGKDEEIQQLACIQFTRSILNWSNEDFNKLQNECMAEAQRMHFPPKPYSRMQKDKIKFSKTDLIIWTDLLKEPEQ